MVVYMWLWGDRDGEWPGLAICTELAGVTMTLLYQFTGCLPTSLARKEIQLQGPGLEGSPTHTNY
jgi:hypothetical protein